MKNITQVNEFPMYRVAHGSLGSSPFYKVQKRSETLNDKGVYDWKQLYITDDWNDAIKFAYKLEKEHILTNINR